MDDRESQSLIEILETALPKGVDRANLYLDQTVDLLHVANEHLVEIRDANAAAAEAQSKAATDIKWLLWALIILAALSAFWV